MNIFRNFAAFITTLLLMAVAFAISVSLGSSKSWPGGGTVSTVDEKNEFGTNISGLHYFEGPGSSIFADFLFAVSNSPSIIYKLYWDGTYWQKYTGT